MHKKPECHYCDLYDETADKCTYKKCVEKMAPEYEIDAADLKRLWHMTDPTELKRRNIPSAAKYMESIIQEATNPDK